MSWKNLAPGLLALAILLAPAATPALAQIPKVGDYYVDDSDLGFKIKMPKDWSFIPPKVGEDLLIGKYNDPHPVQIPLGQSSFEIEAWLLKFDRRGEVEDESDIVIELGGFDPIDGIIEWAEVALPGTGWYVDSKKETKVGKVKATQYDFIGESRFDAEYKMRAYAMVYRLHPDCEVAVVFNGPGDDKKWKTKYKKTYDKMAKSLKVIEVEEPEFDADISHADDSPVRAKKRRELQDYVRRTPGWELYETENYFIVSHNDDKRFMKELMERLEAIRAVYMVDYPPEKARKSGTPESGGVAADEDGEPGEDVPVDPEFGRTTVGEADPMELARTSVVRVCANRDEYHSYGGPGGSAGYWSSWDQELVIYDTRPRSDTWLVLNHEAFHQFIYYFYGKLAPHSWYNEGTGDFYSGYQYKHKKFVLKEAAWRKATAAEMIKTGKFVPLEKLVRWSKREYYGDNEYGFGGGELYAQGWSFVYFLRTGKKSCKDWNDDWDTILDTYLDTLASTSDLDKAVDAAFADVDWEDLQDAWVQTMG
ncbi:MAG: hypothetical protein P1V81_02590 [Planctomycetota bacterium]|nr:hypothetical protein [Planctomycetota bacterium]